MIKNNTKMTSETQNIGFINSTSYCKIDFIDVRAFTAVELKSYNAILAPLIYQKHLALI